MINMMKQNYKIDIMNLPAEIVELFSKIVENDLIAYANEISTTQNISIDAILPLIPKIMAQPMISKITEKYRDTSCFEYKKDLNRFTIQDLKFIAAKNQLPISGNKSELIEKISIKIGLRDITMCELKKSKSYISSTKTAQKKKNNKSEVDVMVNNIIEDSD
jgi:hypothetical protein